ncbi:MAG: hypothetical protein SFH39_17605 [Candidatus Magnetobacterium sp. LHC-1]|uniref:Uncharacterized protein n=1 Tax=Candidatus Magnetobacterium casense TaxID=1455061 RepID=A0ABS6RY62_9BACT|nr:hypothetical protein [Candidatus Magnetobacterium casensis]MBF0607057.1 hypothetical protein [Nitrospirota bacterium]MBV6341347.1 hypothetical protein [Candidatus Magnetobacterium casensis]
MPKQAEQQELSGEKLAMERFFRSVDLVRERARDIDPREIDEAIEEALQIVRQEELEEANTYA